MRIRFICAWYDLWVGAFYDREKRHLYILPVPCLGVRIAWPDADGEYWTDWTDPCPGCTMMICGVCGRPK